MMARLIRALRRDQSGMAALEFGLSLPILVALVMGGSEAANMAYTSQRLGDLATQTADNISRYQNSITETQITDTLEGMKIMTDKIGFRTNGRIIVSSVMPIVDAAGAITNYQVRWQRCSGARVVSSPYAVATNLGLTGIGPTGRKIAPLANTELIFVEISYTYRPLISSAFFGTPTMSALASMTVRDRANNVPITGGTASSCSTYAA